MYINILHESQIIFVGLCEAIIVSKNSTFHFIDYSKYFMTLKPYISA